MYGETTDHEIDARQAEPETTSAWKDGYAAGQAQDYVIVGMSSCRSKEIGALAGALAAAQGKITNAAKDTRNTFFKSNYADLASVWDACRGPLSENGLAVVQYPETRMHGEPEFKVVQSREGGERTLVKVLMTVRVVTELMHSSGQWLRNKIETVTPAGDPQTIGSAVMYLKRYALSAIAGVAPEDEDDDGNKGSGRGEGVKTVSPAAGEKVTDVRKAGEGEEAYYVVSTENGQYVTADGDVAKAASGYKSSGKKVVVEATVVEWRNNKPARNILELRPA